MQALRARIASTPENSWPSEPVPIALVITELDVGGAEKALVNLARGLDHSLWAPTVIALGPEGPLVGPLREARIPVECLGLQPSQAVRGLTRLARALRRARPWLVQSFLFHANVLSRMAAPLAGCPWVVGGLRVAEREKGWHRRLDRLTEHLAAGSVCVSEGVRQFSIEVGGLNPDRLMVIPNGIDVGELDRAPRVPRSAMGLPTQGALLLFVGRIERQKGLPVLFDALRRLDPCSCPWHLAVAGDGPELPRLRDEAAVDPLLAGQVCWLGRRGDVPSLLEAADLLVLPSLWEGMPNVVLEAMAAARPVVATDVEGSNELVVDGETGWLVAPGDPDALANTLRLALSDPERLSRYGRAGRQRVEEHFSQTAVVRAYQRLWARVLGFRDNP